MSDSDHQIPQGASRLTAVQASELKGRYLKMPLSDLVALDEQRQGGRGSVGERDMQIDSILASVVKQKSRRNGPSV